MSLFWLIVGFLVALFLPSPLSKTARYYIVAIWNKIFSRR